MTLDQLTRKARYGHKSFVYWHQDEAICFEPYSKAAIKRAILAVGIKGRFYIMDSAGVSQIARTFRMMIHFWRCAPKA
jgi:hypothetical protein